MIRRPDRNVRWETHHVTAEDQRSLAHELEVTADRCDELAEGAELMGDAATALDLRSEGHRHRMRALRLLDDGPSDVHGLPDG